MLCSYLNYFLKRKKASGFLFLKYFRIKRMNGSWLFKKTRGFREESIKNEQLFERLFSYLIISYSLKIVVIYTHSNWVFDSFENHNYET